MGVTVFRVGEGERVVSVAAISEDMGDENGNGNGNQHSGEGADGADDGATGTGAPPAPSED